MKEILFLAGSGFGLLGSLAFALSGAPQAAKSLKDGHSMGMAHGTIWLWLTGELSMIIYTLIFYTYDWILLLNYVVNLIFVLIIFKYKYWVRKGAVSKGTEP